MISLTDFVAVVVPIFLVSDTYFIKIFEAQHFDTNGLIAYGSNVDELLTPALS